LLAISCSFVCLEMTLFGFLAILIYPTEDIKFPKEQEKQVLFQNAPNFLKKQIFSLSDCYFKCFRFLKR
jgi:hypothetical protein